MNATSLNAFLFECVLLLGKEILGQISLGMREVQKNGEVRSVQYEGGKKRRYRKLAQMSSCEMVDEGLALLPQDLLSPFLLSRQRHLQPVG